MTSATAKPTPTLRSSGFAQRQGVDNGVEQRTSAGSWSAKRGARRAGTGAEGLRVCGVERWGRGAIGSAEGHGEESREAGEADEASGMLW